MQGKYIVTKNLTYCDVKDNNGFHLTLKEDNGYTYASFYADTKDLKTNEPFQSVSK